MNKKPIAIFSTDWHIKDDNTEELIDLVRQKCELAKSLDVKYVFCLGDVFNSRKSQSLLVLNTFGKILDIVKECGLTLYSICGNHDRTDYSSNESFLDQFKYHPSLKLVRNYGNVDLNDNICIHLLPFRSEEIWLNIFNKIEFDSSKRNILCSHMSVNGSINNDGSKQENNLKTSLFKDFHSVLLGHFHNKHKVGKNIYHIPSIQQNNFGETNEKGFTVLYSDGSHELHKSDFKEYIKVKIDVNKESKQSINKKLEQYSKESENNYVRFVLEGSEDKIKSINKDIIKQHGIDVKTVNSEIEIIDDDFDKTEIKKYTNESILEEFELFCEETGKDLQTGLKYLKEDE